MVDRGHGPPVVMIPGVQGRWEWMSPAVDALATQCRVVTGSLAGDRGSLHLLDPARGFASYLDWVDALLDAAGLEQAALCARVVRGSDCCPLCRKPAASGSLACARLYTGP